jgi:glycosyltransferase EpsE
MSEKLVSIIMGVYNCESCIQKSVESIIAQTYSNWELIICDDCSTDNSLEVLHKLQKTDNRIVVIQNDKNSKLAYSLNHCLKYARGEYIARMDDDDISYPQRIELEAIFLDEHPEYNVVGSSVEVSDGEKVVSIRKSRKVIPDKNDLIYGPCHMHPTIMMRKEAYDILNGYTVCERTNRGQDWDLWFRFYSTGMKGYNIQIPLLQYHESITDFKKRTIRTAWMYTRTALYGYKLLGFPFYKYVFAFKPILSALIPDGIMRLYHKRGVL